MDIEYLAYCLKQEGFDVSQGEHLGVQFDQIATKRDWWWGDSMILVKFLSSFEEQELIEWQKNFKQIVQKAGHRRCFYYVCLVASRVSPLKADTLARMSINMRSVVVADESHNQLYEPEHKWGGVGGENLREALQKVLFRAFAYEQPAGEVGSTRCPRCGKLSYHIVERSSDILPPPPGTRWAPLPRNFAVWKCSFCGHSAREQT